MTDVRYPDITVQLTGTDGNAFAILGKVRAAMRHSGVEQGAIEQFMKEATAADYDELLRVCMAWVEVL